MKGAPSEPAFHVVLVEPEIPQNAGSVGRLCLAVGARLHLVGPLGFSVDDRAVRRAGLDYWQHVDYRIWNDYDQFQSALPDNGRQHYCSTKGSTNFWDVKFEKQDWLVFGCETRGLPESILSANAAQLVTIPMRQESTRSLNLATSVGIVLYEAARQTDWRYC